MRSPARPRGREEVSAALIDASVELFADRLPDQVTVREIAVRANVNQGLVHAYFGSKDGLIKATIHHLAKMRAAIIEDVATGAEAMPRLLELQHRHPAFARLLAWWLLEGRDIAELELELGAVDRLLDRRYGPGVTSKIDQRVVAAAIGMLLFGSVVFRGYADARGLGDISDEQFVTELALLTASFHEWNRATD